jgi:hypothetical protein
MTPTGFRCRSGTVTVECSLFGSGYCFFARVIDRRGDILTLSPAPKLRGGTGW